MKRGNEREKRLFQHPKTRQHEAKMVRKKTCHTCTRIIFQKSGCLLSQSMTTDETGTEVKRESQIALSMMEQVHQATEGEENDL